MRKLLAAIIFLAFISVLYATNPAPAPALPLPEHPVVLVLSEAVLLLVIESRERLDPKPGAAIELERHPGQNRSGQARADLRFPGGSSITITSTAESG